MHDNDLTIVRHYHEATKHHFNRFARSLGFLDWASQPDPFRRYDGAGKLLLPLSGRDSSPDYADIFAPAKLESQPVTRDTIGAFFEHALAVSAWKQYGDARWALRCNPSSGNLHPTEAYLLCGTEAGVENAPGVYHYAPEDHSLERRALVDAPTWTQLSEGFPPGTFFVALSSVHWREAWKYGERAYRYCQHDVGHALAALILSAGVLGWCAAVVDALSDADVAALAGLDRVGDFPEQEPEVPACLLAVAPTCDEALPRAVDPVAVQRIQASRWCGRANRLSREHTDWIAIDEVSVAAAKERTRSSAPLRATASEFDHHPEHKTGLSAWSVMKQRRSAVAMDGATSLSRAAFYEMLHKLVPTLHPTPWHALDEESYIHPALIVHRVDGLVPGLYALPRSERAQEVLHEAMHGNFRWQKPPACPEDLPLYQLLPSPCQEVAARLCCDQEIAGAGAFAVAMLAELDAPLREKGAWLYRRLFWEAGMIGQVLYLEAEAAKLRGTGIGCYFDDPTHRLFGLEGDAFQSLYHFTVGGPVEDTRITTLPAYTAERRALTRR
jgi:SagB-type dehydrogenase family enzyme